MVMETQKSQRAAKRPRFTGVLHKLAERELGAVAKAPPQVVAAAANPPPKNPKEQAADMLSQVTGFLQNDDIRALIAAVKYIVCGSIVAGEPMIKDHLMLFLLKHGHRYRSHECELYEKQSANSLSKCWVNVKEPNPESCEMGGFIGRLAGFLFALAEKVSEKNCWDWTDVEEAVKEILNNHPDGQGSVFQNFFLQKVTSCQTELSMSDGRDWKANVWKFRNLETWQF